ncbi:MAG: hypothetical protein HYY24_12580 [Verrucomicrobia bacterium]|nr:hypothetical protein [Verrucomicrobiota bacterium]
MPRPCTVAPEVEFVVPGHTDAQVQPSGGGRGLHHVGAAMRPSALSARLGKNHAAEGRKSPAPAWL